ncbi:MAG: CHC2 zinc finger domain-containing protein [Patescibacteria group bacterium]
MNRRRITRLATLLLKVDIVQVVEHYLGKVLVQKGQNKGAYVTICPFHNEKSPSLAVIRNQFFAPHGFFHCLGCGIHGNAITFVMERTGLSKKDAIDAVMKITKVTVPRGSTDPVRGRRRQRDGRRRLLAARNKKAQDQKERRNHRGRLHTATSNQGPVEDRDDDIPF